MNDYDAFVPNVHFEQIPIKNLVSNQEYQRNLSIAHVQRTVDNFDLYQINPVKVSRRNGINYVFNGQHTIEIIAIVSGSRETPVWCMIYDDLEYIQEADIFANQLKYVKPATMTSLLLNLWLNHMAYIFHQVKFLAAYVPCHAWSTFIRNMDFMCWIVLFVFVLGHGREITIHCPLIC